MQYFHLTLIALVLRVMALGSLKLSEHSYLCTDKNFQILYNPTIRKHLIFTKLLLTLSYLLLYLYM